MNMVGYLVVLVIGVFAGGAGGYLWGAKVRATASKVIDAVAPTAANDSAPK